MPVLLSGKERGMDMSERLTPDENVILRELLLLDTEPHQIPPELFDGLLQQLARSCRMSTERVRVALQGLNDKGKFDTIDERIEEQPG